jgi:hypothetical protein
MVGGLTSVLIRGDGMAARCCAHLLARFGVPVACESSPRSRLPVLLLSHGAQELIRDVFGQPELFRELPPIRRRIVQWGAHADPLVLEHDAVVASEDYLLDRLGLPDAVPAADPSWTIFAAEPQPDVHRFGDRAATATPVMLSANADPSACWIESTENGWLFLIAAGAGKGWLLSVGESSLGDSTLIAPQIAKCGEPAGPFAAAPRFSWPVCGPQWLACGSAALAFDPLCGDGVAHAVREAILACAVIRTPEPVLALQHYAGRLVAGFERHLTICRQFYGSGGSGAWWQAQQEATQMGIDWCGRQLRDLPPFRYRLDGFDLKTI